MEPSSIPFSSTFIPFPLISTSIKLNEAPILSPIIEDLFLENPIKDPTPSLQNHEIPIYAPFTVGVTTRSIAQSLTRYSKEDDWSYSSPSKSIDNTKHQKSNPNLYAIWTKVDNKKEGE